MRCPQPLFSTNIVQHHPKTLLRYAPEEMAAVDGALLTSDPALREGFKQCLQVCGPAHKALGALQGGSVRCCALALCFKFVTPSWQGWSPL